MKRLERRIKIMILSILFLIILVASTTIILFSFAIKNNNDNLTPEIKEWSILNEDGTLKFHSQIDRMSIKENSNELAEETSIYKYASKTSNVDYDEFGNAKRINATKGGAAEIWAYNFDSEINEWVEELVFDTKTISHIPSNASQPLGGTGYYEINHEFFSTDEYTIANVAYWDHVDEKYGGWTDDDYIVVIDDSGNVISSIYIMEELGWTEEDLVINGDFRIFPTENKDTMYNPNDIVDLIHINSFDYNKNSKRLFVSSRRLNMIMIFNLSNLENPVLEFILSNPTTLSYSEVNDITFENGYQEPIIYTGTSEDYSLFGYETNKNYIPHLNSKWTTNEYGNQMSLDYKVNNNVYLAVESKWNLSEEYLFGGQHTVRSLNDFLKNTGVYKDFDPTHEYISFFDNHTMFVSPYQLHFESSGGNVNYDGDKLAKGSFGTHGYYNEWRLDKENLTSYFKVIDIDVENSTAELIYNEELPYSNIKSQAQLFYTDSELYLLSYSARRPNPETGDESFYNIYNIDENWKMNQIYNNIITYDGYRVVPIFNQNQSDLKLGWGLYY